MNDDYIDRMTAINRRLHAAMKRRESNDETWRANFEKSLAELQRATGSTSKIVVASPATFHPGKSNRGRTYMGIKDQICSMLALAKQNLCVPTPTYPRLCTGIDAAMAALGCGTTPEPPQGCSITGCDTGYYCDPASDSCLIKKTDGEACSLPDECVSGNCDLGYCQSL